MKSKNRIRAENVELKSIKNRKKTISTLTEATTVFSARLVLIQSQLFRGVLHLIRQGLDLS